MQTDDMYQFYGSAFDWMNYDEIFLKAINYRIA